MACDVSPVAMFESAGVPHIEYRPQQLCAGYLKSELNLSGSGKSRCSPISYFSMFCLHVLWYIPLCWYQLTLTQTVGFSAAFLPIQCSTHKLLRWRGIGELNKQRNDRGQSESIFWITARTTLRVHAYLHLVGAQVGQYLVKFCQLRQELSGVIVRQSIRPHNSSFHSAQRQNVVTVTLWEQVIRRNLCAMYIFTDIIRNSFAVQIHIWQGSTPTPPY